MGSMGLTVPTANIVAMLEVAYGLRSFALPFGTLGRADRQAVFDRAIEILADRATDRISRGLYRRYVERVEDLIFKREPAAAGDGFLRLFRQDPYLRCSYQSEQADLEDNLILLWTLHAASLACLSREDVAAKVRHAYRAIAGSLALTDETANAGIGHFYRSLGAGGRPMHGLCRFILEHLGPGVPDRLRPPQLSVHMPALFGAFVAEWLKIGLQRSHASRVNYKVCARVGARLDVEVSVAIGERAPGRRLALICPVFDGAALANAPLRHAVVQPDERPTPILVLAFPCAPAPDLSTGRGGVDVRTAAFEVAKDLSMSGAAFLKEIECLDA